jgi:hypothetical protein
VQSNRNTGKVSTLAILVLLVLSLVSCGEPDRLNDLATTEIPLERQLERKNGLEDPIILEYYKEDIQFIYEFTESRNISIDCYNIDLNGDGFDDLIVLLESSMHGGSAGNRINILLNNEDSSYTNIAANSTLLQIETFPPFNNESMAEFYVSDEKTDGFYNIIIKYNGETIAELHCVDGVYRVANYKDDVYILGED